MTARTDLSPRPRSALTQTLGLIGLLVAWVLLYRQLIPMSDWLVSDSGCQGRFIVEMAGV